jgi:hypothetical protein
MRRSLFWLIATLVCASAVRATSAPSPPHDEPVPLSVVLERAARYVHEFESAFALVIGDETYTQHVLIGQGAMSPPATSRTIRSELLFMWIPEDQHWLSIRNVLMVNGKRVTDGEAGLEAALKQPLSERESRLHRLAEHSAQFNIGSIYRNFNNPTLALQFLDSTYQSRFMFTIKEEDRGRPSADAPIRRIDFTELQRPTLIGEQGQDRPAVGSLSVRVTDGAVVRSTLNVAGGRTAPEVSITVDYRSDPKLEMWVPSRMEERYQSVVLGENAASTMRGVTRFNSIRAIATYSNFRRFETSGHLITPK